MKWVRDMEGLTKQRKVIVQNVERVIRNLSSSQIRQGTRKVLHFCESRIEGGGDEKESDLRIESQSALWKSDFQQIVDEEDLEKRIQESMNAFYEVVQERIKKQEKYIDAIEDSHLKQRELDGIRELKDATKEAFKQHNATVLNLVENYNLVGDSWLQKEMEENIRSIMSLFCDYVTLLQHEDFDVLTSNLLEFPPRSSADIMCLGGTSSRILRQCENMVAEASNDSSDIIIFDSYQRSIFHVTNNVNRERGITDGNHIHTKTYLDYTLGIRSRSDVETIDEGYHLVADNMTSLVISQAQKSYFDFYKECLIASLNEKQGDESSNMTKILEEVLRIESVIANHDANVVIGYVGEMMENLQVGVAGLDSEFSLFSIIDLDEKGDYYFSEDKITKHVLKKTVLNKLFLDEYELRDDLQDLVSEVEDLKRSYLDKKYSLPEGSAERMNQINKIKALLQSGDLHCMEVGLNFLWMMGAANSNKDSKNSSLYREIIDSLREEKSFFKTLRIKLKSDPILQERIDDIAKEKFIGLLRGTLKGEVKFEMLEEYYHSYYEKGGDCKGLISAEKYYFLFYKTGVDGDVLWEFMMKTIPSAFHNDVLRNFFISHDDGDLLGLIAMMKVGNRDGLAKIYLECFKGYAIRIDEDSFSALSDDFYEAIICNLEKDPEEMMDILCQVKNHHGYYCRFLVEMMSRDRQSEILRHFMKKDDLDNCIRLLGAISSDRVKNIFSGLQGQEEVNYWQVICKYCLEKQDRDTCIKLMAAMSKDAINNLLDSDAVLLETLQCEFINMSQKDDLSGAALIIKSLPNSIFEQYFTGEDHIDKCLGKRIIYSLGRCSGDIDLNDMIFNRFDESDGKNPRVVDDLRIILKKKGVEFRKISDDDFYAMKNHEDFDLIFKEVSKYCSADSYVEALPSAMAHPELYSFSDMQDFIVKCDGNQLGIAIMSQQQQNKFWQREDRYLILEELAKHRILQGSFSDDFVTEAVLNMIKDDNVETLKIFLEEDALFQDFPEKAAFLNKIIESDIVDLKKFKFWVDIASRFFDSSQLQSLGDDYEFSDDKKAIFDYFLNIKNDRRATGKIVNLSHFLNNSEMSDELKKRFLMEDILFNGKKFELRKDVVDYFMNLDPDGADILNKMIREDKFAAFDLAGLMRVVECANRLGGIESLENFWKSKNVGTVGVRKLHCLGRVDQEFLKNAFKESGFINFYRFISSFSMLFPNQEYALWSNMIHVADFSVFRILYHGNGIGSLEQIIDVSNRLKSKEEFVFFMTEYFKSYFFAQSEYWNNDNWVKNPDNKEQVILIAEAIIGARRKIEQCSDAEIEFLRVSLNIYGRVLAGIIEKYDCELGVVQGLCMDNNRIKHHGFKKGFLQSAADGDLKSCEVLSRYVGLKSLKINSNESTKLLEACWVAALEGKSSEDRDYNEMIHYILNEFNCHCDVSSISLQSRYMKNMRLSKYIQAAAYFGREDIMQDLINAGFSVKEKSSGENALHAMTRNPNLDFAVSKKIMDMLLEGGLKVDKWNRNARRPIHDAVKNGRSDIVAMLLDADSSPNKVSWYGKKEKSLALEAIESGTIACFDLLVSYNIKIEQSDLNKMAKVLIKRLSAKNATISATAESNQDSGDREVLKKVMLMGAQIPKISSTQEIENLCVDMKEIQLFVEAICDHARQKLEGLMNGKAISPKIKSRFFRNYAVPKIGVIAQEAEFIQDSSDLVADMDLNEFERQMLRYFGDFSDNNPQEDLFFDRSLASISSFGELLSKKFGEGVMDHSSANELLQEMASQLESGRREREDSTLISADGHIGKKPSISPSPKQTVIRNLEGLGNCSSKVGIKS